MNEINQHSMLPQLDALSDQDLNDLIANARSVLSSRENERKKDAIAAIRRLAKEHGLSVDVKGSKRKGRPR